MKKWFRKNSMNLFYLPALIIMLTFLVFPLANGFRLSFLKWNGYSPKTSFVGIQNYLSMLTDKNLGTAFRNTLLYGFGSTILQNILGLSAALFVNSRFKGHTAVRTFVYLPIMISSLVMAISSITLCSMTAAFSTRSSAGSAGRQLTGWRTRGAHGSSSRS